jgi:hypothetical protein
MTWKTVRTIRWLLAAVGLALGLVLLAAGATLVGAVLVVLAALRIAMLVAVSRRMRSAGGPGPWAGRAVAGRSGLMLQRLARNELDVAATAIGIPSAELRRAVDDGHTISAVAADAGVPSRRVVDAVVRDASAKVDRAEAAGDVAPNRARMVRRRVPHWAERFVLSTPAMMAGTPRG